MLKRQRTRDQMPPRKVQDRGDSFSAQSLLCPTHLVTPSKVGAIGPMGDLRMSEPAADEVRAETTEGQVSAVLDESKAPAVAVLTRFSEGRMLYGKIEHVDGQWAWHFVLDSAEPHEMREGTAASYEAACEDLGASLGLLQVQLHRRRPSPLLPPRVPGGRAPNELPPLR
jgi:hypothetical protein